jgi:RNA polymerase sigma factor (sigma-70 family)
VPSGPLSSFLRHFRSQLAVREGEELADADLLRRFAGGRDEAAFAALVQRHGPMVLGVCRRLLPDANDADDAFQATFLVLARKAGAVGRPERLASWLYGVALRVARKARAESARRLARQHQVTDMPAPERGREADWDELRRVLDEEMQRLPEKFRLPILLCHLQGKTREEAALQLGWSPGAVKGMLERGRERLRSRLARRGVALSAGSLAALLSENALSAAVPAALGDSTIKAAVLFAAGRAATAGSAAALAEGVLRAMTTSRLKLAAAVVLTLGVLGAGAGVFALGGRPAEPEPPKTDLAAKGDEKAERLRRGAQTRLDTAKAAYEGYWLRFQLGTENEQTVNLWSRRWLQAELELADKQADRDAAVRAHHDRLARVDEIARARLDLGGSPNPLGSLEDELKNVETVWKQFEKESHSRPELVCNASVRLLMAQQVFRKQVAKTIDIKDPNAKPVLDRHAASLGFDLRVEKSEFEAHLDRVRKVEGFAKAREEAGLYSRLELQTATYYRLEAEAWLAQKKAFADDVLGLDAPPKE